MKAHWTDSNRDLKLKNTQNNRLRNFRNFTGSEIFTMRSNDLQILDIDLRRKILINCIPHLISFWIIRIDKTKWTRLGSRMVISDL